jgi:hypothetical protein
VLEREVRANLVYRDFTRSYFNVSKVRIIFLRVMYGRSPPGKSDLR